MYPKAALFEGKIPERIYHVRAEKNHRGVLPPSERRRPGRYVGFHRDADKDPRRLPERSEAVEFRMSGENKSMELTKEQPGERAGGVGKKT